MARTTSKSVRSRPLTPNPLTHILTDKSSFRAMYFSMVKEEEKEPSMYKLIVVGPEEKVLGIHIIGLGSDEVIQGFAVALKMGATKDDLDNTVAIHPTSGEGKSNVYLKFDGTLIDARDRTGYPPVNASESVKFEVVAV